jgi:hypothetical protein
MYKYYFFVEAPLRAGEATEKLTNTAVYGSLPRSEVMGAILLVLASRKSSGGFFSPPALPSYLCNGYHQVGKLQPSDDGA